MQHPAAFWIGFHILIAFLLIIDLGVFHRKGRTIRFGEACLMSGLWIILALLFNLWVYDTLGAEKGLQFFTGYLIEKSLSVDNLFLFLMIFLHFRTPAAHYHRILFWGIIGALFFRIVLILAGIAIIEQFHWMFYVFGAFLLVSGIKFARREEKEEDPSKGVLYRWLAKFFPVAKGSGQLGSFFVRQKGKLKVTAMFMTLVMIECTDIIMALDSIPAIFAVTTDPFIVYTSNIFAILGLRALYFVLAPSLSKLRHIRIGLAAILVFVGAKMLFTDYLSISVHLSLVIIAAILLITILASIKLFKRK